MDLFKILSHSDDDLLLNSILHFKYYEYILEFSLYVSWQGQQISDMDLFGSSISPAQHGPATLTL